MQRRHEPHWHAPAPFFDVVPVTHDLHEGDDDVAVPWEVPAPCLVQGTAKSKWNSMLQTSKMATASPQHKYLKKTQPPASSDDAINVRFIAENASTLIAPDVLRGM